MSVNSDREFLPRKPFCSLTESGKRKRLARTAPLRELPSTFGEAKNLSCGAEDGLPNTSVIGSELSHCNRFTSSIERNNDEDCEDSPSEENYIDCESDQDENVDGSDFYYDSSDDDFGNYFIEALTETTETTDDDFKEFETEQAESINFMQLLIQWALMHRIKMDALSALLKILRLCSFFSDLPADARTLLKTPVTEGAAPMGDGEYYHFGLKKTLSPYLKFLPATMTELKLKINVDGLPLFKSAMSQLWPILFTVMGLTGKVFCAGLYCGDSKPENAEAFMQQFIEELVGLIQTGIQLPDGRILKVSVYCIVCDAPAKCFLLGTKGHTGYSSCTRCTQKGEYIDNKVVFPDIMFSSRTDSDFRRKTDKEFHKEPSIFERVPGVDMIRSFCLDYMHLVCLGVMRKMLKIWVSEVPYKLSSTIISRCSSQLISLRSYIPVEFCRKPRDLNLIKRWKATELRQFLLYTGPVVMKNALNSAEYQNFLALFVAMRILLSPSMVAQSEFVSYARELLANFVESFKILYHTNFLTHNFHNLLHLVDDVVTFGPLDLVSAFPFENFLGQLKGLVRKPVHILSQVIRRVTEITNPEIQLQKYSPPEPAWKEMKESLLFDDVCAPHYSSIYHLGFKISVNKVADSCVGTAKNNIIQVKGISFSPKRNCLVIVGKEFTRKTDFFNLPCRSSLIGIYKVDRVANGLKCWPLSEITTKYFILPHKSEFVVLPLLHTQKH